MENVFAFHRLKIFFSDFLKACEYYSLYFRNTSLNLATQGVATYNMTDSNGYLEQTAK